MLILLRTCPQRHQAAADLLRELNGLDVETVRGHGDPNADFSMFLKRATKEVEPFVALEDDAWPSPDFRERIAECMRPWTDVVQLWSNRQTDMKLLSRGRGVYYRTPGEFSGLVGTILTKKAIAAWAKHWRSWDMGRHPTGWDLCLAKACRCEGLAIGVAIPSLVEHRQLPSTLGRRSALRQSRTFREVYGTIQNEVQLRIC